MVSARVVQCADYDCSKKRSGKCELCVGGECVSEPNNRFMFVQHPFLVSADSRLQGVQLNVHGGHVVVPSFVSQKGYIRPFLHID